MASVKLGDSTVYVDTEHMLDGVKLLSLQSSLCLHFSSFSYLCARSPWWPHLALEPVSWAGSPLLSQAPKLYSETYSQVLWK